VGERIDNTTEVNTKQLDYILHYGCCLHAHASMLRGSVA